MKREIIRLDIMSVAIMYGAALAAIGLFFALLFTLFGSLFVPMMGKSGWGTMMGSGVVMIILLPLFYGTMGLLFGALFAFLYNVLAPRLGGVKVYIRDAVN